MDPMTPPQDPTPAPGAGGPVAPMSAPPVWSVPPMPVPPPVVSSPVAGLSSRRRRDPLTIVMVLAVFVAIGGVAFAVGRVTAPAATTATTGFRNGNGGGFPTGSFTPGVGNNGAGGLGRFGGGGLSLRGTVTEVTADHITLKLANGSTLTIPVDANTAYHQQASAAASDVKSGTTVEVQVTAGGVAGGGQGPTASGAPGSGGRVLGPASDITIVAQ